MEVQIVIPALRSECECEANLGYLTNLSQKPKGWGFGCQW